MICDVCGKNGARARKTNRAYGRGEELLVIESVPVVSCSCCGGSYMTAETLKELERLKLHRRSLSRARRVKVLTYA